MGDTLIPGPLHANGVVDLGDGSGGCGACHGHGDDPTPATGSHPSHARPSLASPFACASCHVVPTHVSDAGHLDHTLAAEITFGALASARGASPTHAADGTCSDVACHGSGLGGGTWLTPRWGDASGLAARCGACHSVPPPPPHTSSSSCSATTCQGGYVAPGPVLTTEGIAVHVNGTVDLWTP
jgi:predicted CxxxxCH...CXXCH cytochrome family protein